MVTKKAVVIAAAAVAAVSVFAFVALDALPPSVPIAYVIRAGTTYDIAPSHFNATQFKISFSETLIGNFTASHGVVVYVMTPTQFTSLSSTGLVSGYLYTTGNLSRGVANTALDPGSYYLVFYNANRIMETHVEITNDFNTS